MKPELEYIRNILTDCEAAESLEFDVEDLQRAGHHDQTRLLFHLLLLNDRGLIERADRGPGVGYSPGITGGGSLSIIPLRLTATGHDFAQALATPTIWARVSKVGAWTLDGLVEAVKPLVAQQLTEMLNRS
jgi:hypothetical protein